MPRPRADFARVHAAADAIEPRLARAFLRAVERMRERVSINDLAMRLGAKDVKGALALLPAAGVKEALAPCGSIVRDTFVRGGKLGAAALNKARGL